MRLIHGDCLDALKTLPDLSVDAVVTDPPAGIAFMGKAWDGDKGGRDLWIAWLAERLAECLRVLKPGGHAVVWALPRTSGWTHRALEDAGFDVRDCVHHLFGSGFPKSLDVGKAIDKANGKPLPLREFGAFVRSARLAAGLSQADVNRAMGMPQGCGWWEGKGAEGKWDLHLPSVQTWRKLKEVLPLGADFDWLIEWAAAEREVVGTKLGRPGYSLAPDKGRAVPCVAFGDSEAECAITAPATDLARQWDGWGTALKPAVEHWWLARKPLDSTVAGTVTRWGTGALNVDACRVEGKWTTWRRNDGTIADGVGASSPMPMDRDGDVGRQRVRSEEHPAGRWPADVVLSHNPTCDGVCSPGCAVAELDQQSGTLHARGNVNATTGGGGPGLCPGGITVQDHGAGDSGGASRFFPAFRYQAKPSTREKGQGLDDRNHHPTTKPAELMRWLCRLVTPPGGVILDPFAGSGTTGVAAILEGFDVILIEAEAEYLPLIEGRVRWAESQVEQPALSFD